MKIATARTKTSKRWRTQDITWEEFLDKLRTPMRTAETVREFKAMGKTERDQAKEAAGGFVGGALNGGQRKTEFVRERWLITLDADNAKPGAWSRVTMLYDFRMAVYSTHSHTAEKPRLRWIVPVDRAMTPDEYPAVARMVASWLDIETMDATTYEVARLMYFPTCPKDGVYEFNAQDGPVLRVDDVLAQYGYGDAWKDATLWPIAKAENEIRVREARKAGDPWEKEGAVGLFCRIYSVEDAIEMFLPEVYTECNQEGRYTYVGGSTAAGAIVYDDGKFLYSNHATDPCQGMSVNAFDLVRIHKFGHLDADAKEGTQVTRLPSYSEMLKFALAQDDFARAQVEAQRERANQANMDFADLAEEEMDAGDPDWEKKLKRDGNGDVEETLSNAMLYVRNLPEFKGKLGYNPMTDSITVKGDLPWRERKRKLNKARRRTSGALDDIFAVEQTEAPAAADEDWQEKDWPDFYAFMEGFGFMTGKRKENGMLENAVKSVAQEQEFHPIKSYLESLEWDGTERLDTMFVRWMGAEDNELNRVITRRWMIAAVDRIVRPGCQFDQILITCGPQGIGKSKLLRMLARGYFTNSIDAPNMSKATAELLQGMWIVELGELDGVRKADQNTLKNFITATTDRYRGAYAREAKSHPRQCVLAGTSNQGSFLRDETGERRYWIMPVQGTGDRGELKGFAEEVDQLWAEAVVRWKERMMEMREPGQTQKEVNLYLYLREDHLEAEMEKRRQGYKLPDTDRNDIAGYLDTPRPGNWESMPAYERRGFAQGDWIGDPETCTYLINKVCIKELKFELFGDQKVSDMRIGDILDSLPGWKKGKKGRNKAYANWPMTMWVRIGSEVDGE